ncbi:hypothetical protein O181_017467 [Austropuccinia psidii MF-1]|uniref:Uncharacterized protein n=1 Tax=Austropuccinia psidii MF-1 TaxID=1389203 RepID=A0A9Q3C7N2_9BASI|nr:hypothetical protein [Austropuccinia psidii MF-1]
MIQLPSEGKFQPLELLWKHVHNVSREQGYAMSTLRSNMTHNKFSIGGDRSGTPNSHRKSSKKVTLRNIDCAFIICARRHSKCTTLTLKVKRPAHSHDATESIMLHPHFVRFNEKGNSHISHYKANSGQIMYLEGSLQACNTSRYLQPSQEKKKEKLKGRLPIYSSIDTLKEENIVWFSKEMWRDTLPQCFHSPPFHKTPSWLL